jgi:hypothetical protein
MSFNLIPFTNDYIEYIITNKTWIKEPIFTRLNINQTKLFFTTLIDRFYSRVIIQLNDPNNYRSKFKIIFDNLIKINEQFAHYYLFYCSDLSIL